MRAGPQGDCCGQLSPPSTLVGQPPARIHARPPPLPSFIDPSDAPSATPDGGTSRVAVAAGRAAAAAGRLAAPPQRTGCSEVGGECEREASWLAAAGGGWSGDVKNALCTHLKRR